MGSLEELVGKGKAFRGDSPLKCLGGLVVGLGALQAKFHYWNPEMPPARVLRFIGAVGFSYALWHGMKTLESYLGTYEKTSSRHWLARAVLGAGLSLSLLYAGQQFNYGTLDETVMMIGVASAMYTACPLQRILNPEDNFPKW